MAKKKIALTEQEIQMIERLRGRPALSKRFDAFSIRRTASRER